MIITHIPYTEAARYRHPSIEAYFWGPGYHHYYHLDSLNSNLEREFGCGFFKMVILHSGQPEIQDEFDSATQSLGCDTLLLVKSGDCNNNQCLWEANLLHANVTIVRSVNLSLINSLVGVDHSQLWVGWVVLNIYIYISKHRYAHEAIEMFSVERILEMKRYKYGNRNDLAFQLIAHVPDTANEWDFYPLVCSFSFVSILFCLVFLLGSSIISYCSSPWVIIGSMGG